MNHTRSPSIPRPNGYAALVSTLIMASIITIMTLELNSASLSQRMAVSNNELSKAALQLAHGCADFALLQRSYDPDYIGNQDHQINGQNCHINKFFQPHNFDLEIITTAQIGHSVAHYNTLVSTVTWTILSQIPVAHP